MITRASASGGAGAGAGASASAGGGAGARAGAGAGSQMLKALLVDDEVLARLALRQALAAHADVAIVGECGTGLEAVTAIAALQPDVVFLDIEMPDADGFDALRALPADRQPLVVFVTAYSTYALRAFDAHAVGYVLKPLDQARFDDTMDTVRTHWWGRRARQSATAFETKTAEPRAREPRVSDARASESRMPDGRMPDGRMPDGRVADAAQRLTVRVGEHLRVLPVDEIDWFGAEGNYVRVHARGATYLHRDTLARLEATLDPARFLRIHRGAIVNVDRVQEVHPLFHGNCELLLKDGSRLMLSRRFRARARRVLGLP
jgi:two-component system LytT family response regulator